MSSQVQDRPAPKTVFADGLDSFLFEAPDPDAPACVCGRATFCPACGELHPAVTDPEVLDALSESGRVRSGGRVIRKTLPS